MTATLADAKSSDRDFFATANRQFDHAFASMSFPERLDIAPAEALKEAVRFAGKAVSRRRVSERTEPDIIDIPDLCASGGGVIFGYFNW
jgi:hypothetical protein